MKILFTMTPAFNPNAGGVQRTTWKLGKYFGEQGLEVAYYSLANQGHMAMGYGTLFSAPKPGRNSNTANILDLRSVIQQIQPDVVINQMPYERELRDALVAEKKNLGYLLLGCLRNSLFNFKNNARDRIKQLLPHPLASIMDNRVGEAVI